MRGRTKCNQPTPVLFTLLQLTAVGLMAMLVTACGSGSAAPASDINNAATGAFSDNDIARALYSDNRTPDSFYQEAFDADYYVSVSHLKNTDLVVAANRGDMQVSELSTDSVDEALAWSEQTASIQPSYRQLVDSSETFMYFQFTRVDPASPQFVVNHRVFKASVLDRAGASDSYLGRVTLSDITAAQIKQLVEYLWLFTNDNNYGNAILKSSVSETDTEFVHVMQQAKLEPSYSGACDTIEVYENRYTIAKDSGFIHKQSLLTRVITARRDAGRIVICE